MTSSFWHRLLAARGNTASRVDPRRRLRLCLWGFLGLLAVVFGRVVHLEVSQGAAFREEAAKPVLRRQSIPGVRGRILAGNGAVLAYDREVLAMAVHYRYLEEPPNPAWLRSIARARLSRREVKDPQRLAAEIDRVVSERTELAAKLARLCEVPLEQWFRRAAEIQARVERIADSVNRRRMENTPATEEGQSLPASGSVLDGLRARVTDFLEASSSEATPQRIVVAEERDYHVVVEDVPLAVAALVEAHPDGYPGVKIIQRRRRAYPAESLAAHVLGHLGAVQPEEMTQGVPAGRHPDDRVGRMGLELRYDELLYGARGVLVEQVDRSGRIVSSYRETEPGVGRDLVLTLDPQLQQAAEELLDDALRRQAIQSASAQPAGGAIAVIDAGSGAVLAAASAPRFDPNLFAAGPDRKIQGLLADPAHPLVDRVSMMAIPPASVFKIVTSAALLESAGFHAEEPLDCQGYLDQPDRWRCAIFRRHGIGHGEVTLPDALAQSCNVYFFHHAGRLGPEPLIDWAIRLGFGRATGIDLPHETAGTLPTPASIEQLESHPWRTSDTRRLAIGQGSLQATPLQVVRMMAAVANGGRLVTPHLVGGLGLPELQAGQTTTDLAALEDPIHVPPPQPIAGLKPATLAAIREGLRRVVADDKGTAHGSVWMESIAVAGKTGTAETGNEQSDHAWFAGYAPAESPKVAFVVALEHSGNAEQSAAPVAKRLVMQIQRLGYFGAAARN